MELLQSWKESLAMFLPKNLKPLLLDTCTNYVMTWKLLLSNFWWLLIICVFTKFIVEDMPLAEGGLFLTIHLMLWSMLWLLIIAIAYAQKNYVFGWLSKQLLPIYLATLLLYGVLGLAGNVIITLLNNEIFVGLLTITGTALTLLVFLVMILLLPFFSLLPSRIAPIIITLPSMNYPIGSLIFTEIITRFYEKFFCFSAVLVFFILFMLSASNKSGHSGKSLRYAGKMVIYNYPFLVIQFLIMLVISCLGLLPFGAAFFVSSKDALVVSLVAFDLVKYSLKIIGPFLISFYLCFLTNFYRKQISEKPQLYR